MLYHKSTSFPGVEGEMLKCSKFTARNFVTITVSDSNLFLVCDGQKALNYYSSPPHGIYEIFSPQYFHVCPFFIPFSQKAIKTFLLP